MIPRDPWIHKLEALKRAVTDRSYSALFGKMQRKASNRPARFHGLPSLAEATPSTLGLLQSVERDSEVRNILSTNQFRCPIEHCFMRRSHHHGFSRPGRAIRAQCPYNQNQCADRAQSHKPGFSHSQKTISERRAALPRMRILGARRWAVELFDRYGPFPTAS